MYRNVIAAALALGAVSPAPGQDRVRYFDRADNKELTVTATVTEETAAELVFRLNTGRVVKVPLPDLLEVNYNVRAGFLPEYRKALVQEEEADKAAGERLKALDLTLQKYREIVPQLAGTPFALRDLEFRVARVMARRADEDRGQLDAALKEVTALQAKYPNSRQTLPAARLRAHLLGLKGDRAAARKVFEELAARKDLSREVQQECELLAVRVLIAGGQHAEAEKKLQHLGKGLKADDPLGQRVQVFLAACQVASGKTADVEKALKPVLDGMAGNDVRGLAHNTLAEAYLKANKPEDAFWQFLMVDVLYDDDREEHARALYHLSKLFEQVKRDPNRAQECRDRLLKEYAGTEYQQRALKEK